MTGSAWAVTVDANGGAQIQAPLGFAFQNLSIQAASFSSSTIYFAAGFGRQRAPQSDDEALTEDRQASGGCKGILPLNQGSPLVLPGVAQFVALDVGPFGFGPAPVTVAAELVPCEL